MTPGMAISAARQAVFDALRSASPQAFDEEMQRAFLANGTNFRLADLEMDSLSEMEFCIAIELATGVTLLPPQLMALGSTDAVEERLREALLSPAASSDPAEASRRGSSRRTAHSHLERALSLYRRRLGRCRTDNERNRLHIALENYMTPMEVRHFAAALAQDPPHSPSRRWIERLERM